MKAMTWKKLLRQGLMSSLLAPVILICLISTHAYGGNKKMEYMYDFKQAVTLEPQTYKIDASMRLSLFPVPMDNAVGTNDIRNAISVISFPKGKMRIDHHFRRAVDDVQGGGTYLPVITKDLIGFGQMRAFYLFNFKTKKHEEYRIVFSLDDTIENIAIADAEKRRFVFEIQSHRHGSQDPWDFTKSLQLIDLSKREVDLVKKVPKEAGSIWVKADSRVLLWHFKKKEMQVFDMDLEPSQHPMEEAIKKNKEKVDFTRMAPHPALPFAILYGGRYGATYINWGEGRDKTPKSFLSGVDLFLYSPDGMWVAFQRDFPAPKRTYLMPVSEKYPNYLGTPILLLNDFFDAKCFAWTTAPVSFVGNNGRNIYRWELTKEARKSMMGDDYDKYETFHDWIVAKDLEKLTKEKKQGLK